jgi:C-terminal processing protease CtpA/Prc
VQPGTEAGTGTDGGTGDPTQAADPCERADQNQFVYDTMLEFYYWNDALPTDLDVSGFEGPQAVLDHLMSFQPLDEFSFLSEIEAENDFFGEGQYPGFGFASDFDAQAGTVSILHVHADSPAAAAGIGRGQQMLAIDGVAVADIGEDGLDEAFGPDELGVVRTLSMRRLDGTTFDVAVEKGVVTIDAVPQWRIIDTAAGPVGYVEMLLFIDPAQDALQAVFVALAEAGVTDVILDLRYNGGGLVRTAEFLGDLLGASVADGDVFSRTLFNDDKPELESVELFERIDASLPVSRLVVIGTARTASASELIINSLRPHIDVSVVGSTTRGKPVGQAGFEFCEQRLRPVTFEKVNALGEGGYFDGIPPDCEAPDDLSVPVGADADPSLSAALQFLVDGTCPPPPSGFAGGQGKTVRSVGPEDPFLGWR